MSVRDRSKRNFLLSGRCGATRMGCLLRRCVLERNPRRAALLMHRLSEFIEFALADGDLVVANPASESSLRCHDEPPEVRSPSRDVPTACPLSGVKSVGDVPHVAILVNSFAVFIGRQIDA